MPPKKYSTEEERAEAKRAYGRRYEAQLRREHPEKVKERQRKTYAKTLQALTADPTDPRHATEYGYVAGCRCLRCAETHRAIAADYRARKRLNPTPSAFRVAKDAQRERIRQMRLAGSTNEEIAAAVGLTRERVSRLASLMQDVPAQRRGRRKKSE